MVALRSPDLDAQPLSPSGRAPTCSSELAARLPAWHAEAACRDADLNLFFGDRGQDYAEARKVCATCPVLNECLVYAIAEKIDMGIFGGLSPGDRRQVAETGQ